MRRLIPAAVVVALAACDPGPPRVDDVRLDTDSSVPDSALLKYDVDLSPPHDVLYGLTQPNGITVGEGFAAVLIVQPLWKKYSTLEELPGAIKPTITGDDVVGFVPVPNERRRFIVFGKKQGEATVDVAVEGAQGSQKVRVHVVAQP